MEIGIIRRFLFYHDDDQSSSVGDEEYGYPKFVRKEHKEGFSCSKLEIISINNCI